MSVTLYNQYAPQPTTSMEYYDYSSLSGSLPPTSSHASASSSTVSPRGFFRINGYRSLEGDAGQRLSVVVSFRRQSNQTTLLRLVLGRRPLTTVVRPVHDSHVGNWQLEATAPTPEDGVCPGTPIPLSVQALTVDSDILDSVVLGSFVYWTSASRSMVHSSGTHTIAIKSSPSPDHLAFSEMSASPSPSLANTPAGERLSPSMSRSSSARSSTGKAPSSLRPHGKQSVVRTRRFGPGDGASEAQRVKLDIASPIEDMAADWTEEEMNTGRRLVKFHAEQMGVRLRVTCERITQDEYTEGDAVISCIYRRQTHSCHVTSVDIICLLEKLAGEEFPIEEKNRIRRNLEGFRPKTISKNRAGTEEFFQQIMDFPAPKPRHIEKDVKVFDWEALPKALHKIMSKYVSCASTVSPMPQSSTPRTSSSTPASEMLPQFTPAHSPSPYGGDRYVPTPSSQHYIPSGSVPDFGFTSGLPTLPMEIPRFPGHDGMGAFSSFANSSSPASLSGTPSPRSHSSFGELPSDPVDFAPEVYPPYPSHSMGAGMAPLAVNTSEGDSLSLETDYSSYHNHLYM
ncbi:hypothetical protein K474DRAFT_1024630 [Panus rudis PR-1116 ss-1]|nr:hypothetical protein K474DRAFT_1024630 [Panus rudis PR-1116 ss-1]